MVFVAVVDEAIVLLRQQGHLTYRPLPFPLQPFWVYPSLRGYGSGSRRLQTLEEAAWGRSNATRLSSTRTVPAPACSHRLGWTVCDRRVSGGGPPVLVKQCLAPHGRCS
jgi:hypothetical protein